MRKILIAATAVMLTAGASLFGASAAEKLKIGFIYLGPIGDLGWTYQHTSMNLRARPWSRNLATRSRPPISRTFPRVPTPSAPSSSSFAPATS